jgi:hypothetical protein
MPAPIAGGIRCSNRSNQPLTPATVISAAETTKAPVAASIDTPAALVINIAAPGVDHAVTTGMR